MRPVVVVLSLVSLIFISCFVAPQPRVIRTVVEKEVEVPVEVVVEKEVIREVEVPVEVVVEREVIREVEVPVEVVVEREVIKEVEVPVEVVVEKEVIKEVIVEKEVIKYIEVPANQPVPQVVRLAGLVPSQGSVILDDVGDSATLSVQGYYSDQSLADLEVDFITYESTDPGVVSVSSDGVVTANGAGTADIITRFGDFERRVHTLALDDIPTLPPIDPSMVGPIPGLDEEVRAVLNRVIIELSPGSDTSDAEDIAEELGGEVVFSYGTFPGYVIEFDIQQRTLLETLNDLAADGRIEAVYPDVLFERLHHPIDTLVTGTNDPKFVRDYIQAGFDSAWRIVEKVPVKHPVVIAIVDGGHLNKNNVGIKNVGRELDWGRITAYGADLSHHTFAVAGVIAAKNDREPRDTNLRDTNLSGIVTSAGLGYHLLSLSGSTATSLYSSLEALQKHGNLIDVANLSIGIGTTNPWTLLSGSATKKFKAMSEVTFVAAAGNCERDAKEIYPAELSLQLNNVITVGGANEDYTDRWTYDPVSSSSICRWFSRGGNSSAFGNAITLAAPGELVLTLQNDIKAPHLVGGYFPLSGTSLAAPMVTGAVALLKAIHPDLTPEQVKVHLVETADKKTICTSTPTPPATCPKADEESWNFLRADKAVAKLLSDRIKAEIADLVFVPSSTQRVSGEQYQFGVEILNTGEMVWPFYLEASVRGPSDIEKSLAPLEIAVAPRMSAQSHMARWGFSPAESGCWDLRVKVSMEGPVTSHLRIALAELNLGVKVEDLGLLADSGWIEEVLEVRSDPSQPEQCSGSDKAVPLVIGDEQDQANVLLLADTSGSMEGQKAEALREAIAIFARRMSEIRLQAKGGIDQDPDHVGLIDFDDYYREVVPIEPIDPTDDGLEVWKDAVDSLDADGGTALYDAIIRSIDVLEGHGAPDRKNVLIALTDGMDQSSHNSFSDAVSKLDQSSVTLFALALSEPGGTGEYDFSVLEELANATDGAAYVADTNNLAGLYELFSTIFEIEP